MQEKKISNWLKNSGSFWFSVYAITAAFITYCSMYAFRKPFAAAMFEGLTLWGIDYKIILITAQVVGYTLSKFAGIRVVSSMHPSKRIVAILLLIGVAWITLFFFGLSSYPWNFIFLFFNGLPLGMIWGIVFSFLEGRRNTELLGAGMSASFIVSSGFVKAMGKYLIETHQVGDFWMPFLTGLVFVPLLFLGVWMLSKIPPPDQEDKDMRTERVPMNNNERSRFFLSFAPGIILVVMIYIALTIFRDLRDNFAVELWAALGFANEPDVLVTAEIPIAISVLVITAFMILIKNNRLAFFANIGIVMLGGVLLIIMTWLFSKGAVHPAAWMILTGFGMYLSYVSYHTMLFERWIALFRYKSNIGYLMYIADAFGYLGSVSILFYRNFFSPQLNWLGFIQGTAYVVGAVTIVFGIFSAIYFRWKDLQQNISARPNSI